MSLLQVLDQLSSVRIAVVGDVMVDQYLWGEVTRISPEAPVPVVHVRRETFSAGGAANVAMNLAALGVQTTLISSFGRDQHGQVLRGLLEQQRIDVSGCEIREGIQTIVKKRVIARTQQLCRIDYEGPRDMYVLPPTAAVQQQLRRVLQGCQAVILSDYAKGFISQGLVDTLVELAGPLQIPVAVDPKPARRLQLHAPWLLTPNRGEALQMAELPEPPFGDPFPLAEVCRRIHRTYSPGLLVVTLGSDGMAVSLPGGQVTQLPTLAQEVFDVSGAGDTVIATLTAAMAAGADPVSAATLANAAAGCVVAHMGTVPVDRRELLRSVASTAQVNRTSP